MSNYKLSFTSTKLLPHLVEFGPSPTQGTRIMLVTCAQIVHLPCLPNQPKTMPSRSMLLPLTWFRKSTARSHYCYFSPNMCNLFDVNILPNLANNNQLIGNTDTCNNSIKTTFYLYLKLIDLT